MIWTQYVCVLYVYAKFEAGSSIRSKVLRGHKISNLGYLTLSHAHFGVIL